MSVVSNNILAGASGQGGATDYAIERSLRFNDDDTAYLSKNFSTAGNRKTWTWSAWVKRSGLGTEQVLWTAGASTSSGEWSALRLIATDQLQFINNSSNSTDINLLTTQVFRDVSAWYHILLRADISNSTTNDRIDIFINGVKVETYSTETQPSTSVNTGINGAQDHNICRERARSNYYCDLYLADVHFIDGQALAPTDFGETDDNGVWQPKKFAGTYGTNGFHLPFTDNSSNAALGTDTSSNNNTWTVNNLVATSGFETANQGFDCRANLTGQFTVNNLNFQPDLIVAKSTSNSEYWIWTDSVRGFDKVLKSNTTDAENSSAAAVTGVGSSGFSSSSNWFTTGRTYSTWCWKAGVAASSNTDGTITTSVSANTSYGFSITSYVGNQTSGATIGHGLNSEPKFAIIKSRDTALDWIVYHASTGNTGALRLNTTQAVEVDSKWFNNAGPSSSTFTLGNTTGTNKTGDNMIAYMWSEVPGFSKFSSYSGNGSTTGPVITTGFKPKFVMVKASSIAGEDWVFMDTARAPSNPSTYLLSPNIADPEYNSSVYSVDFLDNGFQIKNNNPRWNQNGATYIYAAFADKPDGSIIDSLVDTPTNAAEPTDTGAGGEVVGNYATLNPLNKHTSNNTLSNGNLEFTTSGSDGCLQESTIGMSSGKFYFEVVYSASGTGQLAGIRKSGSRNYDNSYIYTGTANKYTNGGSGASYGATLANGDVIGTAFDADNGTLTFYKNGVSQGTAFTGISGTYSFFVGSFGGPPTGIVNFGQRAFAYTAPSGFKSLNTANLPTPTIADGSKYFDTKLYTGNGGTNAQTGLGFSPDFLWLKRRNGANAHALFDEIRGVTKALESSNTGAEKTNDPAIGSFDSNGFTLTGSTNQTNASGQTYVGWAWDGGTSTVTNNDGSIASQVRANPTAGFSIVTYTGVSGNQSFGHGLNVKPKFIAIKNRSNSANWFAMFDTGAASYQYGHLNDTAAFAAASAQPVSNTTVTLGNNNSWFGAAGDDYVAYCFAPVEGYSAMGSYTGNGSADGPFVYTGFRPKWVMIKRYTTTGSWIMLDSERNQYNLSNNKLAANSNAEENNNSIVGSGDANSLDFLSNGFKLRSTNGETNGSGAGFIYAAFAENPFKTARAR